MTDISREAVERRAEWLRMRARDLHAHWGAAALDQLMVTAQEVLALRAALDRAEADKAAAVDALQQIAASKDLEAPSDYSLGWNASRFRLREIADAAIRAKGGK